MAKVDGAIDTTVRLLETVTGTLPTFKFHTASGKEMTIRDLAGLARSVQAATCIRQGAEIEHADVSSPEQRYTTIETECNSYVGRLAK
jgi:hypothetical protein